MFWTIVIISIILFVVVGIVGGKEQQKNNDKLVELGYTLEEKIITGRYVAGHPDINDAIPKTIIFPKDRKLEIMLDEQLKLPIKKAEIEFNFIKNVLAEDATTVEKRITVGRLLTVGIFAFALKKKQKNELAYSTIEWNDGRFDHETHEYISYIYIKGRQ